jgi:3-hydroxybutyrate dehydrogenase
MPEQATPGIAPGGGTLNGKTALVTGAASGIGLAVAERFVADGAHVVIADIQTEVGSTQARRLGCRFFECDLSRRSGCQVLAERVLEEFGTIHILVNNAGFQHVDAIEDFPEDTWDRMLAVMLSAPFLLTKYAWPAMKAQGWGRIIQMSSIHGLVASPFKSGYVTAKHGLIGLTRTAALEGGAYGITVNAICPAYARTPLVESQVADQARLRGISREDVIEKVMLEPAAVKRLIEPSEIADLVAYLCSDSGSVITGSAWTMDLGWTAR